jgi:hypothetical protein
MPLLRLVPTEATVHVSSQVCKCLQSFQASQLPQLTFICAFVVSTSRAPSAALPAAGADACIELLDALAAAGDSSTHTIE